MTALRELREAAGVPRIVLAHRAGVSAFEGSRDETLRETPLDVSAGVGEGDAGSG